MPNIISYSLFGEQLLYWRLIPLILIANDSFFPGFKLRFHVPPDILKHPVYPLIKSASEEGSVELRTIEKPYKGLEPTIWRMMPLWDPSTEYVFARDLDSMPCSEEARAVRTFMKSGLLVHGIRAHPEHNIRLLAGLCGFKRHGLVERLTCKTFDEYRRGNKTHVDGIRGCDQELLSIFFSNFDDVSLDTPLFGAKEVSFKAVRFQRSEYDFVDLAGVDPAVRKICDTNVRYSGAVVGIENSTMLELVDGAKTNMAALVRRELAKGALAKQYGVP